MKEKELKDLKESLIEYKADNDTEMIGVLEEEISKLEKEIAEDKKKPAPKKAPVKKAKVVAPHFAEAKALGINTFGKKKDWILAEIEKKKNPTHPKAPEKKAFKEEEKVHKLRKGFVLTKTEGQEKWTINESNSKAELKASISKVDGKYNVSLNHTTKGFESFDDAVKHLETELYQGILGEFIDSGVKKAKRSKDYVEKNPDGLSVKKSLDNEADILKKKIDEKGVTKKEVKEIKKPVVSIIETIKGGLSKAEDKKDFIKSLIKELTAILNSL